MHICHMLNFRLYFALYYSELLEKSSKKCLLHNKAKSFVSLQVLKGIILLNGQLLEEEEHQMKRVPK